jgi:hypothetical protein
VTPHVTRDEALVLEDVEAAAWRELAERAHPEDVAALGLRTHDLDGAFALTTTNAESLHWNRALGVGLHEPVRERTLVLLRHLARGREAGFAVPLCPFATPDDAGRRLEAAGFATYLHHLKWWRDASPSEPVPTRSRSSASSHMAPRPGRLRRRVARGVPGARRMARARGGPWRLVALLGARR